MPPPLRAPPPLVPGSRVHVVAPSSPFDRSELFRGLAWLRSRYTLAVSASIFERDGYLAGDDARRATELARAMIDPETSAIVCARGGYGAMRIVDALPWDELARRPKWILGFSDVTALHAEANARGICTIHGPNVTGLGRSIAPLERLSVIDALEGRPSRPWGPLTVLRDGAAAGPLVGGNLALVAAMGSRFVVPDGGILVLEDVTERPYRVDRMLTSLVLARTLDRASAVIFGDFTQCDPGPDGVTIDDVLARFAAASRVPVFRGAPFGHGAPNHAFVLGGTARVSGGVVTF